jgi:uncharacterized protein
MRLMKTHRYLSIVLSLIFCTGISVLAQTAEKPEKNPNFDAALAKKVGADKMGMRSYVLAILKTGPRDAEIKGKDRDEMFKGHFANMNRLAGEGKLSVAGPFGKNDKAFRGLFILNVTTVEEAQALVNTDPVVKSGMMIVDLVPWYGSAALMEVDRIHRLISEDKP